MSYLYVQVYSGHRGMLACFWHPIATSTPKSAKPKPSKPNWNHIFEFLWLLVFSYRSPSSSHLLVNPKFLSDLLGIGSMGTFPAVWSQDGCHGGRHLDLGTWFHPSQTSASVMSEISKGNPLKQVRLRQYVYIFTYIQDGLHCDTKSDMKCIQGTLL